MLHDDNDSDMEVLPFEGIDKASVLQGCKCFSAVQVDVNKCYDSMCQVLYLLHTGHQLTATEATEIFFGSTKLFQCENPRMRRMLYIFLKELSTIAEQVFIASSSLVKDISSNDDIYKMNAIRTLRKVTDSTMIGPMERYLKQAVVDRNSNVVSAAIVTGIHLSSSNPEMVKRWGTEVSEALKTRGNKVQYHALALLHRLRKSDRMSVVRLIEQAQNGPIRSPLALCLLIKLAAELMQEDFASSGDLYKFVSGITNHSSDMVVFEAAKAIASLKNVTAKEVAPAVLLLQHYLGSHRPVVRFAAVRLLSRIATQHPSVVTNCNLDLEGLINDPNRNIATFAITALLKAGTEFNVERVLRQVADFMSELNDDFKLIIIDAVQLVARKFPDKHTMLLHFFGEAVREEGSVEIKRALVEAIVKIMRMHPQATELALTALCEFIEDCEYSSLIQRVLYLLGEEGPATSNPSRFIRYINNRIQLESAVIRAAAVTTLAKFAAKVPALRPRVLILLRRATLDSDDEVRDRAVLLHKVLAQADESLIRQLLLDVAASVQRERVAIVVSPQTQADPAGPQSPDASTDVAASAAAGGAAGPSAATLQFRDELRKIPQLRELGEPMISSELTMLTEADNEYAVGLVKNSYPTHVVMQFRVRNTLEDMTLRDVMVRSDASDMEGELEPAFAIPAASIAPGTTAYTYEVFNRSEGSFPSGGVRNAITFRIQEGDEEPADAEEFQMDEFAVNVSDFIIPRDVGDFDQQWGSLEAAGETVDTYSLGTVRNLTSAAHDAIDFFGMHVVGGRPAKITEKSHTVQMAGALAIDGHPLVLIQCRVFLAADASVALQLSLRGADEETRAYLSAALVS